MLCQKAQPIKNSHIIPKFAVRWIKLNCSPYLRNLEQPNLRKEDLPRLPLLCTTCEGVFAADEDMFARSIFKPYQENQTEQNFKYGSWLSRFVISLSWRVLAINLDQLSTEEPALFPHSLQAFEYWRQFLLRRTNKIKPYEHRMFFFSSVDESSTVQIPPRFHSYILRGFDASVVSSDTRSRVYSLLPGMLIWSTIQPPRSKDWGPKSVIGKSGFLSTSQQTKDSFLFNWIFQRANAASEAKVSELQQAKIRVSMEKFLANKSNAEIEKIVRPTREDRRIRLSTTYGINGDK